MKEGKSKRKLRKRTRNTDLDSSDEEDQKQLLKRVSKLKESVNMQLDNSQSLIHNEIHSESDDAAELIDVIDGSFESDQPSQGNINDLTRFSKHQSHRSMLTPASTRIYNSFVVEERTRETRDEKR